MFRKISLCLLLCATASLLFAGETAEIDTPLLDKASAVKYIENHAPVSWHNFNSGKQIRDMGRKLGDEIRYQEQVKQAASPYASGYPSYKYKAVRIYPGKHAGADVLYIGKYAKVDTFKNLIRVVSGYIEKAYGIPMEQADSIAKKVCYWNTNHYNDEAYFRTVFEVRIREVFSNRTSVIGLAKSYKNWPGKTRIVIPFTLIRESAPQASVPAVPEIQQPVPEPQTAQPPVVVQPELQPETDTAPEIPSSSETGSLPPVVLILLGILAAALIVLIIFIVRIVRDKKKHE